MGILRAAAAEGEGATDTGSGSGSVSVSGSISGARKTVRFRCPPSDFRGVPIDLGGVRVYGNTHSAAVVLLGGDSDGDGSDADDRPDLADPGFGEGEDYEPDAYSHPDGSTDPSDEADDRDVYRYASYGGGDGAGWWGDSRLPLQSRLRDMRARGVDDDEARAFWRSWREGGAGAVGRDEA